MVIQYQYDTITFVLDKLTALDMKNSIICNMIVFHSTIILYHIAYYLILLLSWLYKNTNMNTR